MESFLRRWPLLPLLAVVATASPVANDEGNEVETHWRDKVRRSEAVYDKVQQHRTEARRLLMELDDGDSNNLDSFASQPAPSHSSLPPRRLSSGLSGRLVVAVKGGGVLQRANSDGSNMQDWIKGNTPCQAAKGIVGDHGQAIVDSFSSSPTNIAVDSNAGYIFWTDSFGGTRLQKVDPLKFNGKSVVRWLFDDSINRAKITAGIGEGITPIVTWGEVMQPKNLPPIYWNPNRKMTWPYGIALDTTKKHVYWSEYIGGWIKYTDYDGNTVTNLTQMIGKGSNGESMVIDSSGTYLYYNGFIETGTTLASSHGVGHVIIKLPLASPSTVEVVLRSNGPIFSLVLHPTLPWIFFAQLGTTRNPAGILRAGLGTRRRGGLGLDSRSKAYSKDSDAVYLLVYPKEPGGAFFSGRRRITAKWLEIRGMAIDFENNDVFWTGTQEDANDMQEQGLGGRLYRANLCGAEFGPACLGGGKPGECRAAKLDLNKPSGGTIQTLATFKGTIMGEPYPEGIVLLPKSVANDQPGKVLTKAPNCPSDYGQYTTCTTTTTKTCQDTDPTDLTTISGFSAGFDYTCAKVAKDMADSSLSLTRQKMCVDKKADYFQYEPDIKPSMCCSCGGGLPITTTTTTTTTSGLPKVVDFVAVYSLPEGQNASSFDLTKYRDAVAKSGSFTGEVDIKNVTFNIKVTYALAASVDKEKARQAIAQTSGVKPDNVTVTLSRRLAQKRRAAATTLSASVMASDTGLAVTAHGNLKNASALDSQLQAQGVKGAAPTVKSAPATEVRVGTSMEAASGQPKPTIPTVAALAAKLGVQVRVADSAAALMTTTGTSQQGTTSQETTNKTAKGIGVVSSGATSGRSILYISWLPLLLIAYLW